MTYLDDLKKYLTDNPEGYWFKRKLYGWGWVPVSWQGWVVTLGYIVALLLLAFTLDENTTDKEAALMFLLPFAILTGALIRICYTHGEKPKWQWGIPKKEEREEIE